MNFTETGLRRVQGLPRADGAEGHRRRADHLARSLAPADGVEAARQSKHIYCEKPMGWSFRAAQAVRKAVEESGVVFQFGTQQRSGGNFRHACELVRNGRIGQLKTILVGVPGSWTCPIQPTEPVPKELDYDLWLGPAPMAPYCYERCRPWTAGRRATASGTASRTTAWA